MPEILKERGMSLDEVTFVPGTGPFNGAPNSGDPQKEKYDINLRWGNIGGAGTPFVSSNMESVTNETNVLALARVGVTPIIHQFSSIEYREALARQLSEVTIDREQYPYAAVRPDGRMIFGIAVGFQGMREETIRLFQAGAPIVRIDSANGYTPAFVESLIYTREARDYDLQNAQQLSDGVKRVRDADASGRWIILAGNIATAEGAQRLLSASPDGEWVGIASGTACGTWNNLDVHVPQLTALDWVYPILKETDVFLFSDGGARDPHATAVALAFSQGVVMGGVWAATEEAPSEKKRGRDGIVYANYIGSAAREARLDRVSRHPDMYKMKDHEVEEGFSVWLPVRGTTEEVARDFVRHLIRVMWYVGVHSLADLRNYAKLLPLSPAALAAVQKAQILGQKVP
ncbi:IMP dehydrogenase [Candidatus Gottesmanbacteria bacterium]|nr:IMP dehydrogenase [Candidatus Gottesmanbacteria bacterium]